MFDNSDDYISNTFVLRCQYTVHYLKLKAKQCKMFAKVGDTNRIFELVKIKNKSVKFV